MSSGGHGRSSSFVGLRRLSALSAGTSHSRSNSFVGLSSISKHAEVPLFVFRVVQAEKQGSPRRRFSSRFSRRDSFFSFLFDDKRGVCPVEEDALSTLGLEYLGAKADFFKDEVYLVVAQEEKEDDFTGEKRMQRDIHCLGECTTAVEKAVKLSETFAEHFTEKMDTAFYAEIMGKESPEFEKHFRDLFNYLVYFNGMECDGFTKLKNASKYRRRLFKLMHSQSKTVGISRAWEVQCEPTSLDDTNTFLLDLGNKFITHSGNKDSANPSMMMKVKLLVTQLSGTRELARPEEGKSSDEDGIFWTSLGCNSEKQCLDALASHHRTYEEEEEKKSMTETAAEKSIWVVNTSSEEDVSFDLVAEGRLTQIMLSECGEDKLYIVAGPAHQVFVYSYRKGVITFQEAVELGNKFSLFAMTESCSVSFIEQERGLVNAAFVSVFEY